MHTQETDFFKAVGIIAIILGVILVVFIYTMIRHQRNYLKLHNAKVNAIIQALEMERKRIATDIHDELGPILSAVKLQISILSPSDQAEKDIVEFSTTHLNNIISKTREISFNLMPVSLERSGLITALEEMKNRFEKLYPLNIQLDCDNDLHLPNHIITNSFRICQEIMHNTIKHSKAKNLKIKIYQEKNHLIISTVDDGIGFNFLEKLEDKKGVGLYGLQSRADVINALFSLETKEGQGTKYLFNIPLKKIL